jgi:hypothetical protein
MSWLPLFELRLCWTGEYSYSIRTRPSGNGAYGNSFAWRQFTRAFERATASSETHPAPYTKTPAPAGTPRE